MFGFEGVFDVESVVGMSQNVVWDGVWVLGRIWGCLGFEEFEDVEVVRISAKMVGLAAGGFAAFQISYSGSTHGPEGPI